MDDQFDTNSLVDFTGISFLNLKNDVVCCVYQDMDYVKKLHF